MTRHGPPRWATAASWSAARSAAGGVQAERLERAALGGQAGDDGTVQRRAPARRRAGRRRPRRRGRRAGRRRPPTTAGAPAARARERGRNVGLAVAEVDGVGRARGGSAGRGRSVKSASSDHGSAVSVLHRSLGQVDGELDHVALPASSSSRCSSATASSATVESSTTTRGASAQGAGAGTARADDQRPAERVRARPARPGRPATAASTVLAPDAPAAERHDRVPERSDRSARRRAAPSIAGTVAGARADLGHGGVAAPAVAAGDAHVRTVPATWDTLRVGEAVVRPCNAVIGAVVEGVDLADLERRASSPRSTRRCSTTRSSSSTTSR